MIVYLDTSSLVKLYVDEPDSALVQQLVDDADVVVTSVLAYPEARAAFAKRRSERLMTAAEAAAAVAQLDADWPRFVTLVLDGEQASSAGRLASTHRVRGADAVHLAALECVLARAEDDDVRFSSADERLVRAARRL